MISWMALVASRKVLNAKIRQKHSKHNDCLSLDFVRLETGEMWTLVCLHPQNDLLIWKELPDKQ